MSELALVACFGKVRGRGLSILLPSPPYLIQNLQVQQVRQVHT